MILLHVLVKEKIVAAKENFQHRDSKGKSDDNSLAEILSQFQRSSKKQNKHLKEHVSGEKVLKNKTNLQILHFLLTI
jgi:hypothetical protein